MSNEEIEQMLKNCSETYNVTCGIDCPYKNQGSCRNHLMNDTLDYINRLKEEIYQLKQNLGQCENGYKLELHTARSDLYFANRDKDNIAIDLLHTFEIQMHNKFCIEEDEIKPLIRDIKQAVKEKYKLEI